MPHRAQVADVAAGRAFNADDAKVAWTESARQSLAQGGAMAPEGEFR